MSHILKKLFLNLRKKNRGKKVSNNYVIQYIEGDDEYVILIEALEENNETNNIEKLYEDTIALYEKKKKFSLLISLFLKMHNQIKVLCKKLPDIFNKINEEENIDRDKDLSKELSSFKQIYENASEIIQNMGYDSIQFYAVLFCYLNYYDKETFSQMIK
jgi:hypothetical protein